MTTATTKRGRGRPKIYEHGVKGHNLTLPTELVPDLQKHLKHTGESLAQLFIRLLREDLQRHQ